MSCARWRRGFTLVEALVACLLILMVGTLIMQVVIPMARGTVRGTQQVELQQVAAVALNRICQDLQSSAVAGIVVSPAVGSDPLIVSIHPLRTVDTTGEQVWADKLIVYWWLPSESKLWRATWPHGPGPAPTTDEPYRPSLPELRAIIALDNQWRRVQATQVKELKVDMTVFPALVSLSVEAPAPDHRPAESFVVTRRLSLRNERS